MANRITWFCSSSCLERINNGDGYIYLARNEFVDWYAQKKVCHLTWRVVHRRCYLPSRGDYCVDIKRCATLRGLYNTGKYLAAKPWFIDSDWWELPDRYGVTYSRTKVAA
jgi:hypothetical protein